MTELWNVVRDSGWGFVGVLLALASVVLAVRYRPKRKRFGYIYFSQRLIGLDDDLGGRLQLLYDGKPKQHIWIVQLHFFNGGDQEIEATDFHRALQVSISAESEILAAELAAKQPVDLDLHTELRADGVVAVSPTLLNPGDSFDVALVISCRSGWKLKVAGRVKGVSEIKRYDVSEPPLPEVWAFGAVFVLIVGAASFTLSGVIAERFGWSVWVTHPFAVLATVAFGKFLVRTAKKIRRERDAIYRVGSE